MILFVSDIAPLVGMCKFKSVKEVTKEIFKRQMRDTSLEKDGVIVHTQHKDNVQRQLCDSHPEIILRGRVSKRENNIPVITKKRTKRIPNKLFENENITMLAYMFVTKSNSLKLIEQQAGIIQERVLEFNSEAWEHITAVILDSLSEMKLLQETEEL